MIFIVLAEIIYLFISLGIIRSTIKQTVKSIQKTGFISQDEVAAELKMNIMYMLSFYGVDETVKLLKNVTASIEATRTVSTTNTETKENV